MNLTALFDMFKSPPVVLPEPKTVDTVMSAFTAVLDDLQEVSDEAMVSAKYLEEQIVYTKESMARRIADMEISAKVQVNEAERANAIIKKISELVK